MRELTAKEVEQVSGGWATIGAGALIGAAYGGILYATGTAGGAFSWSGLGYSMAGGLIAGAVTGTGAGLITRGAQTITSFGRRSLGRRQVTLGTGAVISGAGGGLAGSHMGRSVSMSNGGGSGQGGGCW